MSDRIRAAAEDIVRRHCGPPEAYPKSVENTDCIIRTEVKAERDRILALVRVIDDDTYYYVVQGWIERLIKQIEEGGA